MKHIGRIIGAALMAAVVGACSGQVELGDLGEAAGGDSQAAAGMVDRWFELARSGQEDFGWWLLHPNNAHGLRRFDRGLPRGDGVGRLVVS